MTETPAAEHLTAELVTRRGGRALQAGRYVVAAVVAAVGFGTDAVATLDLVVRRIDNGREVMRTAADVGDPERLLDQVREDLRSKTVTEFFAEWTLADPSR